MNKNNREKNNSPEQSGELERIGILINKFLEVIPQGIQTHEKIIKRWERGQIIWNQKDIDRLIELNAPIEVYFRYGTD